MYFVFSQTDFLDLHPNERDLGARISHCLGISDLPGFCSGLLRRPDSVPPCFQGKNRKCYDASNFEQTRKINFKALKYSHPPGLSNIDTLFYRFRSYKTSKTDRSSP